MEIKNPIIKKIQYNSSQLVVANLIPQYKLKFIHADIQQKKSSNNMLLFNKNRKRNNKQKKQCASLDLYQQIQIKEEDYESSGRPIKGLSESSTDQYFLQESDQYLPEPGQMLQQSTATNATIDSQKENLNCVIIQQPSNRIPFVEKQRIATFSGLKIPIVNSDSSDDLEE